MSKGMERMNQTSEEDEGLCPSLYSFHSSPEEKNKLLSHLTQYGLETTVDRSAKKDRIRQWIQNSVIEEEDDQEVNDDSDKDVKVNDSQNDPVGERDEQRGPISESKVKGFQPPETSRRAKKMAAMKKSPEVYKPPVDPRIPLENQRKHILQENADTYHGSSVRERESGTGRRNSDVNSVQDQSGRFDIASALPFQNMKISNSLNSSESTFSSDSNGTIKHNINIQVPQVKTISRNGFIR